MIDRLKFNLFRVCVLMLELAMERDKFMNPTEAKEFGLLDIVVEHPPLPASAAAANS